MTEQVRELIAATVADLPPMVTRRETASFLRNSRDFVSRLIDEGELVAVQRRARTTSPILILRESIRNYLERTTR